MSSSKSFTTLTAADGFSEVLVGCFGDLGRLFLLLLGGKGKNGGSRGVGRRNGNLGNGMVGGRDVRRGELFNDGGGMEGLKTGVLNVLWCCFGYVGGGILGSKRGTFRGVFDDEGGLVE